MLRKKPLVTLLAAALILVTVLGLTAVVYGTNTASDPLVTLGYVNGTYKTNLLGEVDAAIATKQRTLTSDLSAQISQLEQSLHTQNPAPAANDFTATTLTAGKTFPVSAGSEVLFLSGSATAGNAAMTDTTAGTVLVTGGAMAANHLYVAIGDSTIKATGDVKFLIK